MAACNGWFKLAEPILGTDQLAAMSVHADRLVELFLQLLAAVCDNTLGWYKA